MSFATKENFDRIFLVTSIFLLNFVDKEDLITNVKSKLNCLCKKHQVISRAILVYSLFYIYTHSYENALIGLIIFEAVDHIGLTEPKSQEEYSD